jgi:hypothetical protein
LRVGWGSERQGRRLSPVEGVGRGYVDFFFLPIRHFPTLFPSSPLPLSSCLYLHHLTPSSTSLCSSKRRFRCRRPPGCEANEGERGRQFLELEGRRRDEQYSLLLTCCHAVSSLCPRGLREMPVQRFDSLSLMPPSPIPSTPPPLHPLRRYYTDHALDLSTFLSPSPPLPKSMRRCRLVSRVTRPCSAPPPSSLTQLLVTTGG